MQFSERLKIAIAHAGYQARGFAPAFSKKLGVTPKAINKWLNNESMPTTQRIDKLAEMLDVSTDWLLSGNGQMRRSFLYDNATDSADSKGRLPLISWVRAGNPDEAIDNLQPGDADEWLDSPFPYQRGAYLLKVDGLSMYHPDGSGYNHGEIIQVQPGLAYKNGSDVIARSPPPDSKATFKRYIESTDGAYLMALNPDWPERIVKMPDNTVISGVIVGSWRDRKK